MKGMATLIIFTSSNILHAPCALCNFTTTETLERWIKDIANVMS
jgi:hypothetical protein